MAYTISSQARYDHFDTAADRIYTLGTAPAALGRGRSVSIMAQIRFACKSDLLLFPAGKAPRGGKGPAFAYIFPLFLFFSAFLYKIYGVFRKFKVTTAFKSCIIEEKFSQAPKLQK